jgi:hypothetical protein
VGQKKRLGATAERKKKRKRLSKLSTVAKRKQEQRNDLGQRLSTTFSSRNFGPKKNKIERIGPKKKETTD